MSELLRFILLITLLSVAALAIFASLFINNLNKYLSEFFGNLNSTLKEYKDLKSDISNSLEKVDQMSETVSKLSAQVEEIKERTFISMDNLDSLTTESKSLLNRVNTQADVIIETIQPYKDVVNTAYENFAGPVKNIVNITSAAMKAYSVFKTKFRR